MFRALLTAMLAEQRRALCLTGGLRLANTLLQTGPPVLLAKLLRILEDRAASVAAGRISGPESAAVAAAAVARSSHWSALRVACLLTLCLAGKAVVESQYFYAGAALGVAVKQELRTAT